MASSSGPTGQASPDSIHTAPSLAPDTDPAANHPIKIPAEFDTLVDHTTWGSWHSLEGIANLTEPQIVGYIVFQIQCWRHKDVTGRQLWCEFTDEFGALTDEDWDRIPPGKAATTLRNFLIDHGVFVPRDNSRIKNHLIRVSREMSFHDWTQPEIDSCAGFSSRFRNRIQEDPKFIADIKELEPLRLPIRQATQPAPTPEPAPRPGFPTTQAIPPIAPHPTEQAHPIQQYSQPQQYRQAAPYSQQGHYPQQTTPPWQATPPQPGPPTWPQRQSPFSEQQQEYASTQAQAGSQFQPQYYNPPPTTGISGKQVLDLEKHCKDDMKYDGEPYNLLDSKIAILIDNASKLGIGEDLLAGAFTCILKGKALQFYYDRLLPSGPHTFAEMTRRTKSHFETEERTQYYMSAWRSLTLQKTIADYPGKDRGECLDILLDQLSTIQRALPSLQQDDKTLRDAALNACQGIEECKFALYSPAPTYEQVRTQLRSAVATATGSLAPHQSTTYRATDQTAYYTDRSYQGSGRSNRFGRSRSRGSSRESSFRRSNRPARTDKKCYVCGKTGCWSTNHPIEERTKAFNRFKTNSATQDRSPNAYAAFLVYYEGMEGIDDDPATDSISQFFAAQQDDSDSDRAFQEDTDRDDGNGAFQATVGGTWFTDTGQADGRRLTALLSDTSYIHLLTKGDPYRETDPLPTTFTADGRYSTATFQGIMPDSGAAGFSTAGHKQFQALRREYPEVTLDTSRAGEAAVKFGQGEPFTSIGKTTVPTPLGPIDFHVVELDTPFLLCLQDMDKLGISFDNLNNFLQQGDKRVPVVRKYGHPWMQLTQENLLACNYLTEVELRRLHRRFGHPSVARLHRVLERAGHPVETQALELITKVCHQCQMHAGNPTRFKFTLRDDVDFNREVLVDIMHLEGKSVLHVVDSSTAFNAARFLDSISTTDVWGALRLCWIDVYLGPPDTVVTDAGKQFVSAEFNQEARLMAITVKEVPIEAHNSIGKVERYHGPLRRAYDIIRREARDSSPEACLQMAVKAINDTAGPDGLVPTLLVFGAYPRMTEGSAPSPSMRQRATAIKKATDALRKYHAERKVQEALHARNGPDTSRTLSLPLQSLVRVYRKKVDGARGSWTGPFKLINVDGENCTIEGPRGPQTFRSTVVKPYYTDDQDPDLHIDPLEDLHIDPLEDPHDNSITVVVPDRPAEEPPVPVKRGRGRPRKNPLPDATTVFLQETDVEWTFLTVKEETDAALAAQLRAAGKIKAPGDPFEASTKTEIDSLIARGVFNFVRFDPSVHGGTRIFKSRIVNEVKGKNTDTPYEKSRLVIQGYADSDKEMLLTQSPTIQRASQRLILAITPSLLAKDYVLWLRDITQAYVQSESQLQRRILAQLPVQIRHHYPPGTLLHVIKPLYGIAEAGTHWWATYHAHHIKKLQMMTSTYDPCLLISTPENPNLACIGMQTDDTLGLSNAPFSQHEDDELKKADFTAKPKTVLTVDEPLAFNGGIVTMDTSGITLRQKGQATRLQLVDASSRDAKQQYVEQRARGAYIASICQPEACFDLSSAAQHQDPSLDDIKALNRRLQWQMESQDRGLTFLPLELATARLYVFVDGSFANNKDLSSQLGFAIILANETTIDGGNEFTIQGNLIHFSSTKSKRVTRSVLASEVYGMVAGVDMAYALSSTLQLVTSHLDLPPIPTVVCTDSYSLYECLVKLGTTKEKRLMIDIMALRQSYERRELNEVRWIHGDDNLADGFTKASPNRALEQFIDRNTATIRVEGWVSR